MLCKRTVRNHPVLKQNYGLFWNIRSGAAVRPFFVAREGKTMERYSVIKDKNPREIVLLRGSGCRWRACTFCDYHSDASPDESANFALNSKVLDRVTGEYHRLEVINSGSFPELDDKTIDYIGTICREKGIATLHIECHWIYRRLLEDFRQRMAAVGAKVAFKIGVESFDSDLRDGVLRKGMDGATPEAIAEAGFSEVNLLVGIDGQSVASMKADIELGLRYFERICVNIMTANSTSVKPNRALIEAFLREVYPLYKENPRVDILLENTDFGVG